MQSRTKNRSWTLVVLALLLSVISVAVRADVTSVTLVAPGTYGEDDDYFSRAWGNPRDMNDPEDVYVLASSCGPIRPRWTGVTMADGVWSGVTSAVGESSWVTVLNPGWVSSLDVGEDGQLKKVDTSYYRQLTFRMRVANGAGSLTPRIEWADGPIGVTNARGLRGFRAQGDGQWHVYSVNLGLHSDWASGPVSWLWFNFEGFPAGYRVEIDWVRLSPRQNRRVEWRGSSLQGTAKVYLGPNAAHPEQYGDLLLYEANVTSEPVYAGNGSLTVPVSLPGGEYYARVEAGGTGANSAESWRFLPLPVAEISAPSYTSGEDWATTVLGNPWDMAGRDDVSDASTELSGIQSMSVSDGVLTVVSKDDGMADCGEPWPHRPLGLNLGGQHIDQNKYKYFSYRYKVDQAPDQGAGGVHRVRWQARYLPYWPTGRTDDLSLYDNAWHTYSLNLETVQQEGEMGEWEHFSSDVMQIMLHESHRQWTSHLDWVKLTAENEAGDAYAVRWTVLGTSESLTTTVYWAQKVGETFQIVPGSGSVIPMTPGPGGPGPSGPCLLYLPLTLVNAMGESEEFVYVKSTQGLSTGQAYYVAIKLEDGYNESMWYSALPVYVR